MRHDDQRTDEGLLHLEAAVDLLNSSLPHWEAEGPTVEQSLQLLANIRGLRQRLADIEAILEAHCAKAMPSDTVELPGLLAQRKGGAKRTKWDHERLVSRVLTDLCVDTETGVIDEDGYNEAKTVVDALLACAAIARWRVTALRDRGIPFDDACETEYGRRTVHISAAEPADDEQAAA